MLSGLVFLKRGARMRFTLPSFIRNKWNVSEVKQNERIPAAMLVGTLADHSCWLFSIPFVASIEYFHRFLWCTLQLSNMLYDTCLASSSLQSIVRLGFQLPRFTLKWAASDTMNHCNQSSGEASNVV